MDAKPMNAKVLECQYPTGELRVLASGTLALPGDSNPPPYVGGYGREGAR